MSPVRVDLTALNTPERESDTYEKQHPIHIDLRCGAESSLNVVQAKALRQELDNAIKVAERYQIKEPTR